MSELLEPTTIPEEFLDELRKRARESLYFFAKAILGYDKLVPRVHGPLCQLLQEPTNRRLRILLPRGWFKTTICSIAYPIWRVINNPDICALIAQNTMTNAVSKLSAIDSHFHGNELFRALFPEILPDENCSWRVDSMQVKRQAVRPEGTFEAAGTGTKVVSRHYDIIIEDDTVSPDLNELGEDNLAPTKDDIEQAIGWHRLVPPLLVDMSESQNIVVGTRWFEKDLLSWVGEHQKTYKSYVRASRETNGLADPNGEITFPERFNEEVLEELKAALGPYMYSCLYMNLPMHNEDMTFQLEWFQYYETEPQELVITTTVDPGSGDPQSNKSKTDYNVVMTTGKDMYTGDIYVINYDRFKSDPGVLLDKLFHHVRLYHPVKVGIESVQYQKSLLYWTRERMKADNVYFLVEALTGGNKPKVARIKGLQPILRARKLHFKRWMRELVNELVAFPLAAHDDLADALAMHLPLWNLTSTKPKQLQPSTYDPFDTAQAMDDLRRQNRKPCTDPLGDLYKPLMAGGRR